MKPTELRIGNPLLDAKGRLCKVEWILEQDFSATAIKGPLTSLPVKPIQLTEDVLLKCGAKKTEEFLYEISINEYTFCLVLNQGMFMLSIDQPKLKEELTLGECTYLHEFQNIVFCISKSELIYVP